MHEYRQIIVRLRLGETVRGLTQSKLASRKKIRAVRKIATQQKWLDPTHDLPSDNELAKFFKPRSTVPITQSHVLPYKEQVEVWCKKGIQASTIHAALQRQYEFKGSYDSVQRFVKKIKDSLSIKTTMILDFKPGECAQVDFGAGPKLIDELTGAGVAICMQKLFCIRMLKHG